MKVYAIINLLVFKVPQDPLLLLMQQTNIATLLEENNFFGTTIKFCFFFLLLCTCYYFNHDVSLSLYHTSAILFDLMEVMNTPRIHMIFKASQWCVFPPPKKKCIDLKGGNVRSI